MGQAPLLDLYRIPLPSEDGAIHALLKCSQPMDEGGQEIRSLLKSQADTFEIVVVGAADAAAVAAGAAVVAEKRRDAEVMALWQRHLIGVVDGFDGDCVVVGSVAPAACVARVG